MSMDIIRELNESVINELSEIKLSMISRKVKDKKAIYKTYKIDWNIELKTEFIRLIKESFDLCLKKKSIKDYMVVSDDLTIEEFLLKYKFSTSLSFNSVINIDLNDRESLPYLNNLTEICNSIWGYVISCSTNDGKKIYFFKKSSKSKIYTDKKSTWKKLRCNIDTSDAKLNPVKENTLEFDNQFDCIFYGEHFYILNKQNFEKLIDLEEEFNKIAKEVILSIENTNLVTGVNILKESIYSNKIFLKRVISIANNGQHMAFNEDRLTKIKEVNNELGLNVNIHENNIIIENTDDVDIFLKFLNQFYVKCMQTSEVFGANSKIKL